MNNNHAEHKNKNRAARPKKNNRAGASERPPRGMGKRGQGSKRIWCGEDILTFREWGAPSACLSGRRRQ